MLPYVDEFRPIHNLNSMRGLVRGAVGPGGQGHEPKAMLKKVA